MKSLNRGSLIALMMMGALACLAGGPRAGFGQQPAAPAAAPPPTGPGSDVATAPAMERIATASRLIPRGTVLTADDIIYVDRPSASQGAADPPVGAGWVTRRIVNPGEVIRRPAVEPPIVLTANETVDATWSDGTVQITIRGIVTRSAALGDRVTIRTADGRHLDAIVTGPGNVRIV